MAKNLITAIQVKLMQEPTITAISWPPPLISQLFYLVLILKGPHLFLQHRCFGIDIFVITSITQLKGDLNLAELSKCKIFAWSPACHELSKCASICCVRSTVW